MGDKERAMKSNKLLMLIGAAALLLVGTAWVTHKRSGARHGPVPYFMPGVSRPGGMPIGPGTPGGLQMAPEAGGIPLGLGLTPGERKKRDQERLAALREKLSRGGSQVPTSARTAEEVRIAAPRCPEDLDGLLADPFARPVDIIDFRGGAIRLGPEPYGYAPSMPLLGMTEFQQEALKAWVEQGGAVWLGVEGSNRGDPGVNSLFGIKEGSAVSGSATWVQVTGPGAPPGGGYVERSSGPTWLHPRRGGMISSTHPVTRGIQALPDIYADSCSAAQGEGLDPVVGGIIATKSFGKGRVVYIGTGIGWFQKDSDQSAQRLLDNLKLWSAGLPLE
jgi:hypothetical protein